ncbi:MAG: CooT family nickel-binding protein [Desulfamplus sp.]|nr:CooT family nickel-binding protein [Desulfamplus sp.]MBF0413294.1 CooT family nickel-binding protein [Desulfamplus sp.]
MCESNAYLIEDRKTESEQENHSLIMEAIDKVIPEEDGVRVMQKGKRARRQVLQKLI